MHTHERFQAEFHPEYSRMSRQDLTKIFSERFPYIPESEIQETQRHQLVALIMEQEDSPDSEQDAEIYSVLMGLAHQRRSRWYYELPKTLASGQSLYYCWEEKDQSLEAASAIAKDELEAQKWNIGEDVSEDDLLLTVLDVTPPLVTALEKISAVAEDQVFVESIAVFSNPISLYDLETMIDSGLPRSSKALSHSTGRKVIKALNKFIKDPIPVFISAGQCSNGSDPHINDAVHVLAILQRDVDDIPLCDGCGKDVDAKTEVHFFRPQGSNLNWEIQDHVDDVGLLCQDCHTVVHGPTKSRLRKSVATAPKCPQCGAGNPREALWGMPMFHDDDNYVIMGCVIPDEPMTEWVCRECDTPYAVVANPETYMPREMIESILQHRLRNDS